MQVCRPEIRHPRIAFCPATIPWVNQSNAIGRRNFAGCCWINWIAVCIICVSPERAHFINVSWTSLLSGCDKSRWFKAPACTSNTVSDSITFVTQATCTQRSTNPGSPGIAKFLSKFPGNGRHGARNVSMAKRVHCERARSDHDTRQQGLAVATFCD